MFGSVVRRSPWGKKKVVVAIANEDGSDAMRLDTEVEIHFLHASKEFYVIDLGGTSAAGQHKDLTLAILDWLRIAILEMNHKWKTPTTQPPSPPRSLLPEGFKDPFTNIDRLLKDGE